MNTARLTLSRLRPILGGLLVALLVASSALVSAPAAHAAEASTVTAGQAAWGYKASFRTYVGNQSYATPPASVLPAGQRITVAGGAAFDPDGAPSSGSNAETRPYLFPITSGTVTDEQNLDIRTQGTVGFHFPSHCFDAVVGNPRVIVSAGVATLRGTLSVTTSNSNPGVCDSYPEPTASGGDDVLIGTAAADVAIAADGTSVTVALSGLQLSAAGGEAMQGFAGEGDLLDGFSLTAQLEAPVPAAPAVVVSKTTNLDPAGDTVTVTGSGFLPNSPATNAARPPLAPGFGGVYVVFGKFQDVWQQSTGADAETRKTGDTKWAVPAASFNIVGGESRGAIVLNEDGTFTTELKIDKSVVDAAATGNYGIYTYAGGGSTYAGFETFTPISFTQGPAVVVSKTTNLDPAGDTLTVTGSGFLPNSPATNAARPPLAPGFGGTYVVFGKFQDVWQQSTGADAETRKTGDTKWAVPAASFNIVGGESRGAIVLSEDGTFTTELKIDKSVVDAAATGNYGIYTYAGGGSTYAGFETFTPISFTALPTALTFTASPAGQVTEGGLVTLRAALASSVPGTVAFSSGDKALGTATVNGAGVAELVVPSLAVGSHQITAVFTPQASGEYASSTASLGYTVNAKPIAAAGSLTWGFKEAFRNYVTGSIAKGSITTSGVGNSGGAFIFGQRSGGTFDGSTGTSNYSGSLRFTGHSGVLDLTLANPVVRVDSASSATLLLNVNGSGAVPFASLNLATASRSTANGAVSYRGAPATLTAQGAAAFSYDGSQFYPAGTALDSVSFVIGSASAAGGGTVTVAAFTAPAELPATPPATTGLTLDPASLAALRAGSEVTITGEGFAPGETGIRVVVYSDPILLSDSVTADAAGIASWTGNLPKELTGTHTITMQGSVDRGLVLDIPATVATAALTGCPTTNASLTWGFKEAFRSYISGSIAHGEWTTADGASYATPDFSWADGTGSYDAETGKGLLGFTGSITFTGHGGILNTTVANPQLRFDGADKAVLLLDVSGTTQEGVAIDQPGVEFATIDLSAAKKGEDGQTVTFTAAPAVLLKAGSNAFGTYEAGETLDPITVSFTTEADCGAIASEEPTAITAIAASADTSWLWWVGGGILLLALIAALVAVMVRRRAA